jgi:uncharacterized membrane protein YccC
MPTKLRQYLPTMTIGRPGLTFHAMAPRSPRPQTSQVRGNVLEYEIVQEQAAALGRLGRALEAALTSLAAFDAADGPPVDAAPPSRKDARMHLLQAASYALWCFIVQREACGLRDQGTVIREYRVPTEVRNRMGLFPNSPSRPSR